jgi:PTS IIA-like nitrogen-regulatory protein PtsN
LGQGIAIPHGRIKGLKDAAGAFLRLATPVQFDAPTAARSTCCSCCWCPSRPTNHLQLLSELAQMFSDRVFREALQNAPDAAHIHQMFMTWGADAADQRSAAV